MPYNTNPIHKNREITGQAQLPLARVKRIIGLDSDINMCSNNAAFVMTVAAELFVQHLAEQGLVVVRSERKPRRNIQYKDLAQAVSSRDNLEFLSDVIPRTVPFKEAKAKKPPQSAVTNGEGSIEAGQTTLDGRKSVLNGVNGNSFMHEGDGDDGDESVTADPNTQLEMEMGGGRASTGSAGMNGHDSSSQDVEMS